VRSWLFGIAFAALLGLWLFSHVAPTRFGECREVAVTIGSSPTVRDCQPYGSSDFGIVLAILAALFFFSTGDAGDVEISIPGFGTWKKTGKAREAASLLKEESPTLDKRTIDFLEGLRTQLQRSDKRKDE
jgi:hypothetical protein